MKIWFIWRSWLQLILLVSFSLISSNSNDTQGFRQNIRNNKHQNRRSHSERHYYIDMNDRGLQVRNKPLLPRRSTFSFPPESMRSAPMQSKESDSSYYKDKSEVDCPNCILQNKKKTYGRKYFNRIERFSTSQDDSLRLEAIKRQILSKLGLSNKPNITSPIPKEVLLQTILRTEEARELFMNHDSSFTSSTLFDFEKEKEDRLMSSPSTWLPDSEPDDFYGRTSEIITFAEPGQTLNGQTLIEFPRTHDINTGETGPKLRVKAAALWVRVDFKSGLSRAYKRFLSGQNLTLYVFRVNRDLHDYTTYLSGKEFDENTEMSASLPVTLSALGWQKFDITSTVRDWFALEVSSKEKLRLLIDCSGCREYVEAILFPKESSNSHDSYSSMNIEENLSSSVQQDYMDPQRPFLVIHTDPIITKRFRRRALDCSGALRRQCCKQKFFVSFQQLGWEDWIIAPRGYYANYCRGDCGGTHRTPDTFLNYYSHVIEEYRKMDRLSGMQPCCTPLKFSSISLIYFGPDSNIIKRDLPKMVVDECGCP